MTDRSPRVLYGITKSNFGGAQRYVFDLATAAKKEGFSVEVLCGGRGALADKLSAAEVKVTILPSLGRDISTFDDSRSFFFILENLHRYKPDVFHINSSKMAALGGLAARFMRVPKIIFTAHGWAFNEPRPEWQKVIIKFIHWITILLSHKTICVSEKTKKDVERWPFIRKKLIVIRNGIGNFQMLERSEARGLLVPGISDDTLLAGTLSELHRVKGLDTLLLSWSEFVKEHKAHLVLMGDGDEMERLKGMAEKFNISDSVTFKGFMDNARRYLPGLDLYLQPSRSEALSLAILEAGMARLPVLATSVGGIPEIIVSGENGMLATKDDPLSLLNALRALSTDESMRQKLGNNLYKTVKDRFSRENMLRETFYLYT